MKEGSRQWEHKPKMRMFSEKQKGGQNGWNKVNKKKNGRR